MRIICRTYVIAQIGLLTLLGLVGIGCQAPPPFAPADSLPPFPIPTEVAGSVVMLPPCPLPSSEKAPSSPRPIDWEAASTAPDELPDEPIAIVPVCWNIKDGPQDAQKLTMASYRSGLSERIVTVQEAGGQPEACRVLRNWTTMSGQQAWLLESLATGQHLTVVQSATVQPGAPLISALIYRWSDSLTPPEGAPLPPVQLTSSATR